MKTVRPNTLSLIIFRLIIVTTLLSAAVIIQLSTAVFLPLGPFYFVVLASYGSCLFFLILYLRDSHVRLQADAQIFFDLLIITALVYITGGIGGHLYVLYMFPIIAAGLVLPARAAYLTASLAAILFGFLADGMFYGLIPYFRDDQARETSAGLVLYTIFLAWALFFAIAFLFAHFGRSARRSRETLAQIQHELQVKERLAEAGQMSALIAHEIRNPLAAISGAVQVLQAELRPAGDAAELMSIVQKESRRVSQTLDQFLNLASPGPQEFTRFRPGELIREMLILSRMGGDWNNQVTVEERYEEAESEFYGSPGQFKQVVWNLIRNAAAAMPGGGVLRVECAHGPGPALILSVADTGSGMTPQEQSRIFEPFYSTFPGGRGLGLAVVRRIVEDYQGTIRVQSEPGRGTEFKLTLPDRADPRKDR
jgi:two-component system sensor histidine kinase PilS (NtrC family)